MDNSKRPITEIDGVNGENSGNSDTGIEAVRKRLKPNAIAHGDELIDKMSKFQNVNLAGKPVTDRMLYLSFNCSPDIRVLCLRDCENITGELVTQSKTLANLEELDITGRCNFRIDHLKNFIKLNGAKLQTIRMNVGANQTVEPIDLSTVIFKPCAKLNFLHLEIHSLNALVFNTSPSRKINLSISLARNDIDIDQVIARLATVIPEVALFRLEGIANLPKATIERVSKNPHLRMFAFNNCDVTQKDITDYFDGTSVKFLRVSNTNHLPSVPNNDVIFTTQMRITLLVLHGIRTTDSQIQNILTTCVELTDLWIESDSVRDVKIYSNSLVRFCLVNLSGLNSIWVGSQSLTEITIKAPTLKTVRFDCESLAKVTMGECNSMVDIEIHSLVFDKKISAAESKFLKRIVLRCKRMANLDISNCPVLEYVDIDGCTSITTLRANFTPLIERIELKSKLIQTLNLAGCNNLRALTIPTSCADLTTFNLAGCTKLDGGDITRCTKASSRLESLDLTRCAVTSETLELVSSNHFIKVLKLNGLDAVDDVFIDSIRQFKNLNLFEISRCANVTIFAVIRLFSDQPSIQINVSHCPKIGNKEIELARTLMGIQTVIKNNSI